MGRLLAIPAALSTVVVLIATVGLVFLASLVTTPPKCYAAPNQNPGANTDQPTDLNKGAIGDGGSKIPKKAVPWIHNLATKGKYHYADWFVAADMMQESSFNPKNFTNDSNDGTRGLVQINQEEWNRVYKSKTWDEDRDNNGTPDIMDPMIHTETAAKLWDEQVDTIKRYKKEHPNSKAATTSDAVLLLVSHNAGPGRVSSYPNIPASTKKTYVPKITGFAKQYGGDITKLNFPTNNGGGNGAGAQAASVQQVAAGAAAAKKDYKLPKVKPHVKAMADYLGAKYGIKSVGGWRAGSDEQYDQAGHPSRLALDFMINDIKDGSTVGDRLAAEAKAHAKDYGVKYIIFKQKIWNSERNDAGWRKMSDRGSPTQNHMDHVHISFQPTAGTNPPSGDPKPDTADSPKTGGNQCSAKGDKKPADDTNFPKGKHKPGSWGGYQNGKIDESKLKEIPWAKGQRLRTDATDQLIKLNTEYKKRFGNDIPITDSYRDYPSQVRTKREKGKMAATPGKSNHGWALALDLGGGIQDFGTAEHKWMKENAPKYGWLHPDWAEPSGSLPEPWHWEYWGSE